MPGLVPAPALAAAFTQRGRRRAPKSSRGRSSEIGSGDSPVGFASRSPGAARSHAPAAAPLFVRGSFARWEEPGGDGARPGHRFSRLTGFALGVSEPQHHTHGPAPTWAPPSYRHLRQHRAVLGGGTRPERHPPPREGTGWPRLSPTSLGEDGAQQQQRNKARQGHRDEERSQLAPCSHRLSVPSTSPGRTERPLGARCSFWGAGPGLLGRHSCSGFSSRCCSHSASTTL